MAQDRKNASSHMRRPAKKKAGKSKAKPKKRSGHGSSHMR